MTNLNLKSITTITKLYAILTLDQYQTLQIIQSNAKRTVSRRFWNQELYKQVDTTLRQPMYSSDQVYEYFNESEIKGLEVEGRKEMYLMILDRYLDLVDGAINKLTIAERVEFYSKAEDINVVQLNEKKEGVRIWGWLDTESEVEEIRKIVLLENGKWDLGKELVW